MAASSVQVEEFLRRPIEVDDEVLGIEHDHGVAHILHDGIASHRHDVEQPEAQKAPGHQYARRRKAKGRRVQGHVGQLSAATQQPEKVAQPGDESADQDDAGLGAKGRWGLIEGAGDQDGADGQQGVGIRAVEPEPGPIGQRQEGHRARCFQPDLAPDQVVEFVGPGQGQRSQGDY